MQTKKSPLRQNSPVEVGNPACDSRSGDPFKEYDEEEQSVDDAGRDLPTRKRSKNAGGTVRVDFFSASPFKSDNVGFACAGGKK